MRTKTEIPSFATKAANRIATALEIALNVKGIDTNHDMFEKVAADMAAVIADEYENY